MQAFVQFLSYNNAVPIALTVLLTGAGATFAATNPESIYTSTQTVLTTDNTYIAGKNLSTYTPRVQIMGVTEDTENYYVAYRLTTIDIVNAVWQDVVREEVLTVAKGLLGEHGDLGLYATEQFKQIVDRQLAYLRDVQEIERRAVTPKTVATAYRGLVGQLLDEKTEALPGYIPVVAPPVVVSEFARIPGAQVAGAAAQQQTQPPPPPPPSSQGNAAPVIQLLGPSPQHIPVGFKFSDLGVVVTDDSGNIPPVTVYVNGAKYEARPVIIDTSQAGNQVIRYEATDGDGNKTAIERSVVIYSQSSPPQQPPAPTSTTTPGATTTEPEPEPVQPTPEPETPSEPEPEPAPQDTEPGQDSEPDSTSPPTPPPQE